jgi:crotonobetainyl-CoA:carnitine CoA-transferase CaiB-like acyl-CoA transferase
VLPDTPARGPLGGLRILERADGLPASYAGFLLGGLGAEVVKVEAPGAVRRTRDHVLQRGKLSVTLDPALADAMWRTMLAGADAVLSDADVPADTGLVRCVVTGWGAKGHPRDLPADEALIAATGGVPALQWSWSKDPVWLVTPIVSYMTGMLAAIGVTAALYARLRGAPGQAVRVSGLGGAFALNSGTFVSGPGQQGSLSQQGDPRGVYPNYSFYPTADGWIFRRPDAGVLGEAHDGARPRRFARPSAAARQPALVRCARAAHPRARRARSDLRPTIDRRMAGDPA